MMIILQVEENRVYRTYKKHKRIGQVKYFNIRDNHGSFYLDTAGRYVIIPSTYLYDRERQYLIRIFTEYKADILLVNDHVIVILVSCTYIQLLEN